MRIYLVGGALRDLVLKRPAREFDYAYFGSQEEFLRMFPSAQPAGKDFPIYIVRGREFAPGRGPDILGDLERRDLTINALALDLTAGPDIGNLFAHPLALEDIRNKILRPASATALADDPVRVFRVARFAARLPEFSASEELLEAMRDVAASGVLGAQTAERVGAELLKALATPAPGRFFELLATTGALKPWFVELAAAAAIPAGPVEHHAADVLSHTLEVMNRLAGDPLRTYMGLCHDLGKIATDTALWPHHYGHEQRGGPLAEGLGLRLKLSLRYVKAGALAARLHMQAGRYAELRPGTRVDLLDALYTTRMVDEMFDLAAADHGVSFHAQAQADLERLLSVKLPHADQNLGPDSGRRLRELRAQAVSGWASERP